MRPRPTAKRAQAWGFGAARWAALAAVLIAWGLRLWDIGALRIFGDSSYSVYLAGEPIDQLLRLTAADSHPPLYYLLLAAWLGLLGPHEVIVRYLSLAPALVAIPLTFQLGRRTFGDRPAVIAAVLLAFSPFAFHYARLPRMYGWVMVAILIAALALLAAARTNQKRDWVVFGIAAWCALHLHYFTALGLVALNLWALPLWRQPHQWRRLLLTQLIVGLCSLPWFVIAFLPSAAFTAGNISNAPPPVGLLGFLEQYVIPFAVGVFVDESVARPVAWAIVALLAILALWLWLPGRRLTAEAQTARDIAGWSAWLTGASSALARALPLVLVLVPLALTLLVFVPFPYFARQRFLLFSLPFALVLVGTLLDRALLRSRLVGALAIGLLAAAAGLGLAWVIPLERYLIEPDAVQLADAIRHYGRDDDLIYLQAPWQEGYLDLHAPHGEVRTLRGLAPDGADEALTAGRAIWVVLYQMGDRDPRQPLPAWLDEHATKVYSAVFGPSVVARYVSRPSATAGTDVALGEAPPVAQLERISIAPGSTISPGEAIAVGLDWAVNRPADGRIAFFLHLDDLQGRTWAGRDGEPQEGIRSTDRWAPGERIEDARGLLVGPEVPAGEYQLVLGAYRVADGAPVRLGGSDALVLGKLRVEAAEALPSPAHRIGERFGEAIELAGYETSLDRPQPVSLGVVNGRLDTPIALTRFKDAYAPGETVEIDLHWRALALPDRDYTVFVHVVNKAGQLVAQHDGPPAAGMRPTASWRAGETVVDRRTVQLPGDLAAGSYRVLVGLYRVDNGERLKTPPDARGRVRDAVELGPIRVVARAAE